MKKFLSFLVLVPLLIVGCSQVNEEPVYEGNPDKGALVIRNANVSNNLDLIGTRAEANVDIFTLIVQDENDPGNMVKGVFSSFTGGKVEDLTPGNYTVTLTSHPDGFTPAFDDAWYEVVETGVNVAAATNTSITMEAVQANAGVYFVYDPSLAAIGEVVPTIVQNASTLVYEDDTKEAIGYFHPEAATLTVTKADGTNLTIQGEEFQTLQLSSEQLWEITLRVGEEPVNGSITITATVKVITEPNVFETFILGEAEEKPMIVVIPPTEEDGTLRFTEADMLMFGENITAARYGLFTKSSVDAIMDDPDNELTLEDLMAFNGRDMSAEYLALLNSPDGLGITYINLTPGVEYSFIIMPTKEGKQKAYRTDIKTLMPSGDLALGDYSIPVVANPEFDFAAEYTNYIPLAIAGDNFYHVGDTDGLTYADCVFQLPSILEAYYTPATQELTFTGYDTDGYYVLVDIGWYLNYQTYLGAVVMHDENGEPMDPHVWLVDDNKLLKPKGDLYLWAYDLVTEEPLGWVERVAEGAVFSYTATSSTYSGIKATQFERIENNSKKSVAPNREKAGTFKR